MSVRNLEALFAPGAIAVVGACESLLRNLQQGGFKGPVWRVDEHARAGAGTPASPDVESLPGVPDLAIVCLPAAQVPGVIAALGRQGTRAVIVLDGDLQPLTGEAALCNEQAMLDAARPHLLRILGTGSMGVQVGCSALNASLASGKVLPGKLALVTQAGASAAAVLDWAGSQGIGFSHFISLGAGADVDFGDVLDYMGSEPGTRVILLDMESVKSARKFMSAARAASRNKPVIVFKPGTDALFDAAVSRAGMLRVNTREALFEAAETFAHIHSWRGSRLAIVTNSGTISLAAMDALARAGAALARFEDDTLRALGRCVPSIGPQDNPVNVLSDAPASRYQDVLRILLAAREVDAVLFMHAPTGPVPAQELATACLPLIQSSGKLVLSCWMDGPGAAKARAAMTSAGIARYAEPERAVAAWLQLVAYAGNQQTLHQIPADALPDFSPDCAGARQLIGHALDDGRELLNESETRSLLQAYGIPVPETLASPAADEVGSAALKQRGHSALPHARVRLGIASDEVFGPVILLGGSGVAGALLHRRGVALPPLNTRLASDLLERSGLIRTPAEMQQGLLDTLQKVSRMSCELDCLAELDVDPLVLDAQGALALAARARLRRVLPGEGSRLAIRPYPAALEETVQLGINELLLRPIRPEDGQRLMNFYAGASPADMRLRFFMTRREVPRSELARYSQIDYDREMTFIALAPHASGEPVMVAEVRAVCDPDNLRAEFAIQVASGWQGKGLGRLLLAKLALYLRGRDTAEIVGECLPENRAMAGLARQAGFEISTGRDAVTLRLSLR